jgi:hypothetical protein
LTTVSPESERYVPTRLNVGELADPPSVSELAAPPALSTEILYVPTAVIQTSSAEVGTPAGLQLAGSNQLPSTGVAHEIVHPPSGPTSAGADPGRTVAAAIPATTRKAERRRRTR